MTPECVEFLQRFVSDRPDVVRFFKRVESPDEMFFQTILKSSPLADTLVHNHLHYADWSGGGPHPATLTTGDFQKLRETPALFARKFDATVDRTVLDLIDEKLLGRR